MCGDLSCYRVFYFFLTPSFILLGASAKFRCLRKLSHPSLLGRQVKTVIFISKITITTKSPILHFAPMRTYNNPHFPKNTKITVIWHAITICIYPGGLYLPKIIVWARDAHDIVTESQVSVQEVHRFGHSGFVSRNWFK